ncbi:MAG: 4Fe-4S binding protein [Deltaproteobacteria bacterium]|nr:4Fe-4S binding protein [Deltaproteobacteria bacterium]
MGRPCIVCQENCPVSPKAIIIQTQYEPVRSDAPLVVRGTDETSVYLQGTPLPEGRFGTGDYYLAPKTMERRVLRRRIVENTADRLILHTGEGKASSSISSQEVEILIRLQRPYVDPALCIGCGICEHECPVSGKRAIRVTAENESREKSHRLLPGNQ